MIFSLRLVAIFYHILGLRAREKSTVLRHVFALVKAKKMRYIEVAILWKKLLKNFTF